MQHYFLDQPLEVGKIIELPEGIFHHFVKVMRADKNSKAEFVANDNQVFVGELVNDDEGSIKIIEKLDSNTELPINVTIVCGIPKGSKADMITEKATEMGVSQIIFVPTDWSIAKWDKKANKKVSHLQKVAQSASEQSHRNSIPKVGYFNSFKELLDIKTDLKLVAYEESAKQGESSELVKTISKLQPGQTVAAFFGSEGGISPAEVNQLKAADFHLIGLGPRILRTETAPLYFLAAVSTILELDKK